MKSALLVAFYLNETGRFIALFALGGIQHCPDTCWTTVDPSSVSNDPSGSLIFFMTYNRGIKTPRRAFKLI